MDALRAFFTNRILLAALAGWFAAQLIKTVLYTLINREFRVERLVGSGGMPSSHAAAVCAMVTATGIQCGLGSPLFAISFIFALIVLYDARGVRHETGKQATVIKAISEFLETGGKVQFDDEYLKEFVGHTSLQVLIGSLLGILIGLLIAL